MGCPVHGPASARGCCRLGVLYASDAGYRALFDGEPHDGNLTPHDHRPLARTEKCLHLGPVVERVDRLVSPRCGVWHSCETGEGDAGKCRPSVECQTCPSFDPDGNL